MNTSTVPIGTLAIVFTVVSIWWIATTLKEGRKAEAEIRNRRIEKAKNAPIKEQKKRLNKLLDR